VDETLEQQIARLTSQVSDLTTKNTELTSQLDTRTGELRSVRHRATFKEVALKNGVKPKAVDSLYRLSGYEPGEADEADPAAMTALIEASREDHDYCFEPAQEPAPKPGATAAATTTPAKPTALGATRGKPAAPAPGKFRVSMADTRNPSWLEANQKAYAEAGKNGTLEIVD
jgi:hypothetical protein